MYISLHGIIDERPSRIKRLFVFEVSSDGATDGTGLSLMHPPTQEISGTHTAHQNMPTDLVNHLRVSIETHFALFLLNRQLHLSLPPLLLLLQLDIVDHTFRIRSTVRIQTC
jgi:hypothetical protein